MTVQSAYQEEQERLAATMEDIRAQLKAIGPAYTGNDFTEQMLELQREDRERRLEIARKEPYFGRIDFEELPKGELKPLYIGKAGVAKGGSNDLLVIDWRAPVASLFYSFTGGEGAANYDSPDGEISGHVHLKRNLMVRQGELVRMVDSYVRGQEEESVTDEFLLYRLGENKDNRLRDIVSTIQQEQDQIIRADKNRALFIQGVAGSGKTTVALHRLAYLLYQYAGRIQAERMIIFAPNRMFLDYISGVLPELGVGDIQQTTFAEWSLEQLPDAVSLRSSEETLNDWFEQHRSAEEMAQASGRLLGSLAFKAVVDKRLEELESYLVPEVPFEPLVGFRLRPSTIQEWYDTDYGDEPLMKKRERLASRIRRWLESELKTRGVTDKKIRSAATAKLNAYVKKIPSFTALQLYLSLFVGKPSDAVSVLASPVPPAMAAAAAARLKKKLVQPEDLAPLVYIQLRMNGLTQSPFDHIVIDEAQDYSPFQLEALKLCQRQPSMTVLGDLQQGIHAYSGIYSWKELTCLFDEEQTGFFELNRSYRSTMEIIEFANRILGAMDGEVKAAVPVFRSGDAVDTTRVSDEEWLSQVQASVRAWEQSGSYETIAVIGRTAAQCRILYDYLLEAGHQVSLVESKQPAYEGGVTVVPVYLSKGLEFDAVLVADAGAEQYEPQDAKLLYVGCTRALHQLRLLYRGDLTTLLS
ncbi:HelD family protein [Paenibacillus sp. GCM10023252]|uniref:HelD family protein n=1 Tax=Paenibacillus sp. GCM10023252 TaxID=3252649 RepID=UPI00360CBEAE